MLRVSSASSSSLELAGTPRCCLSALRRGQCPPDHPHCTTGWTQGQLSGEPEPCALPPPSLPQTVPSSWEPAALSLRSPGLRPTLLTLGPESTSCVHTASTLSQGGPSPCPGIFLLPVTFIELVREEEVSGVRIPWNDEGLQSQGSMAPVPCGR